MSQKEFLHLQNGGLPPGLSQVITQVTKHSELYKEGEREIMMDPASTC